MYSLLYIASIPFSLILLPLQLVRYVSLLGGTAVRLLGAFFRTVRGATYRWFTHIPLRRLPLDQQKMALDLGCILWIIQTSLDKAVHLSALKHLSSMPGLARFHPTLAVWCFNIFTGCIDIGNGRVVIIRGMEELATVSANAFFRTLHYFATMDQPSGDFADLQRRYREKFPSEVDFTDLPFHPTMAKIHSLATRFGNPRDIRWENYGMPAQEHIPFARRMVQASQEGFEQSQHRKVPRWILRSVLYFLSLGPASPPSVIADCLTIIAIDLGCDIPSTTASDERYVQILYVATFLTKSQYPGSIPLKPHHSEA